ncbi:MAG TPA: hypothetical protein DCZ00_00655 [Lactococcus sp.]|uniref:hypothetical protein n=1 Tax=Lactococcus TaxID=1357 RepID=UPI000E930632|nr:MULTISPECIES: hypothetical protein [Lactococcus]HBC89938.1 hypothetical protein [Lactococcus sp.]
MTDKTLTAVSIVSPIAAGVIGTVIAYIKWRHSQRESKLDKLTSEVEQLRNDIHEMRNKHFDEVTRYKIENAELKLELSNLRLKMEKYNEE